METLYGGLLNECMYELKINGIRPSIVFKSSSAKYGEDIIVIPITSFKDGKIKSIDEFDIEIKTDENNNLKISL